MTNTGMQVSVRSQPWIRGLFMVSRRNFSMIIDLPLLVGPTSNKLGMRCLVGHS
jgi:hypothetical protein